MVILKGFKDLKSCEAPQGKCTSSASVVGWCRVPSFSLLQNVSAQGSLGGACALQSAGFTLNMSLVLALSWELCRWSGTALCANSPDCREQPQQCGSRNPAPTSPGISVKLIATCSWSMCRVGFEPGAHLSNPRAEVHPCSVLTSFWRFCLHRCPQPSSLFF